MRDLPAPAPVPVVTPLPLVAVFVGTDHHAFDRLVSWVSTLGEEGWARWFLQHGSTAWDPGRTGSVNGARFVDQAGLDRLLREASAVVTHGGPGMIMDAHLAGHTPVVVPRDPRRHEHVDDHQMRFVERIARDGQVHAVTSLSDLRNQVRAAMATGPSPLPDRGSEASVCRRFAELVAATRHRHRAHAS